MTAFSVFFRTFASKLKTKQIMDDEIKDDEILKEDGGEYLRVTRLTENCVSA